VAVSAVEGLRWVAQQDWSRQLTIRQLLVLVDLTGVATSTTVAHRVGTNRMSALVTLRRLCQIGLARRDAAFGYERTELGEDVVRRLSR